MKGVLQVTDELLASLHPLELKALPHLKEGLLLSELCKAANLQEVEATRALQWLENKKALTAENTSAHEVHLDKNGKKAVEEGMPETRFLFAARKGAKTNAEIATAAKLDPQELGVSIGLLKKQNLITVNPDNTITVTQAGMTFDTNLDDSLGLLRKLEKHYALLDKLNKREQEALAKLKMRKEYVTIKERKDRIVHLTPLGTELAKIDVTKLNFADKLTAEDLKTGAWKEKQYRSFDVTGPVRTTSGGKEHFVQEAIEYIRRIWIEMGFQEMEGGMVQSAFWNLDALFVPQDHPAREMQDTFYLANPARTTIARNIMERVKAAHENGGGTGSTGWRTTYSRQEAEQLLLRTQTTALSASTLALIKEGKKEMPGKYFVVGKVFRNEALDWKHLFEFHQVEGIVVDPNVTFAQLIGYLKIFFSKMGFKKILLRPSYFPFTEPSVEIAVWNERKEQWVELGGAGVFRPEVTKALIGEEVPVLAWGLGLERIIVEYFGLTDLRDLYRNDIKQLREMKRFIKIENDNSDGDDV